MGTADKIHLNSFASLFGEDSNDKPSSSEAVALKGDIQEIPVTDLIPFHNHTFKVDTTRDDFRDLVESIRQNKKILNPVLVRPYKGKYEIISGHRRTEAGKTVGLLTIPCIVKDLSDDEATVVMVDSNIQRTDLLPSEKANSYKAKFEALKHLREEATDIEGESRNILGEDLGESGRTITRYISLTRLIPPLLEDVDAGLIKVSVAYDLAALSEKEQNLLYDFLLDYGRKVSVKQGKLLREMSGSLTEEKIEDIFRVEYKEPTEIVIKKSRLMDFFPKDYTISDMENIIYRLLTDWSNKKMKDEEDKEDKNGVGQIVPPEDVDDEE